MRNPLPAIVLVLAAGVLTGAQLGKIAPLVGWYQSELGLSLVMVGWLTAVLGIFIALAAMPGGYLMDRIGLTKAVAGGAAFVVAGGIVLAWSQAPAMILGGRLIEAVGYLSLCVGLPAVLTAISPPSWRGPVLAIWSGFVPLGFAFTDLLAVAMLPEFSPRTYLLAITAIFALLIGGALALVPHLPGRTAEAPGGRLTDSLSVPVALVAIGFGLYVVLSLGLFAFLPSYAAGDGAHLLLPAGVVMLTVPLGNVLAGWAVAGRGGAAIAALACLGFALSAVSAAPTFMAGDSLIATASAVVLAVSGALVASALFAIIPFILGPKGSAAVVFGLVCQAGGVGTVFGPPLAAWVIEGFGYAGFGVFLALLSVLGLAILVPVARRKAVRAPLVSAPE